MSSPSHTPIPRPVIAWRKGPGYKIHTGPDCQTAVRAHGVEPLVLDLLGDLIASWGCRACAKGGFVPADAETIEQLATREADKALAGGFSEAAAVSVAEGLRSRLSEELGEVLPSQRRRRPSAAERVDAAVQMPIYRFSDRPEQRRLSIARAQHACGVEAARQRRSIAELAAKVKPDGGIPELKTAVALLERLMERLYDLNLATTGKGVDRTPPQPYPAETPYDLVASAPACRICGPAVLVPCPLHSDLSKSATDVVLGDQGRLQHFTFPSWGQAERCATDLRNRTLLVELVGSADIIVTLPEGFTGTSPAEVAAVHGGRER